VRRVRRLGPGYAAITPIGTLAGLNLASLRKFWEVAARRNSSLAPHGPRRSIDRHLFLDNVRQALKPFYSSTGRPSIDPELMIRMLIVGYCMGIRSERRLCDEVHLNLAY